MAAQARLSLHLSKCHIVGNHMSQLIYHQYSTYTYQSQTDDIGMILGNWLGDPLGSLSLFCPVVVDSLFIVAPIVCGCSVFGLCFVIQYFMSFQCCNHLDGEERAGCFTLIVFLMSWDC